MKIKRGIVGIVSIGFALALHAQDAAQSSVDLGAKTESTPSAVEPEAKPEQTPVAPQASPTPVDFEVKPSASTETKTPPPEVPELSQLDEAFKETSLGKAADEFRTRIEWRKLQNDAASDPVVVTAKKSAEIARTDLEKRERLRDYYEIYYAKMRARASTPEMRTALENFKKEHLKLLAQPRVRPNSDLPMETPEPSRGKKHKN